MPPNRIPFRERFDQKWRLDAESGCWVWEAALYPGGYGKIFKDGKLVLAHRTAWEFHRGPIPPGMVLDHTCNRKNCINPDHLDPVTVEENTRRRNLRGHTYEQVPTLRTPKRKLTLRERFDAKWKLNEATGCWEWTAYKVKLGYGRMTVGVTPTPAYRVGYELYVGPIPDGLHLDHLCRNPSCVNPTHLEPVTPAENVRRGNGPKNAAAAKLAKTHCKRGHPFSDENLIVSNFNGQRICRQCRAITKKLRRGPVKPRNIDGLKLGGVANGAKQRSKTHCPHGHPYSGENLYIDPNNGQRCCRACHRIRQRERNRSRRSA